MKDNVISGGKCWIVSCLLFQQETKTQRNTYTCTVQDSVDVTQAGHCVPELKVITTSVP